MNVFQEHEGRLTRVFTNMSSGNHLFVICHNHKVGRSYFGFHYSVSSKGWALVEKTDQLRPKEAFIWLHNAMKLKSNSKVDALDYVAQHANHQADLKG